MKKFFLTLLLFAVMGSSAYAEEVRRELPGNAVIVTDTDRPTPGVRINNDESVYYRALFGRDRLRDYYDGNPSGQSGIHQECARDNRSNSSRRACVRRAIREYEHSVND